MGHPREMSDVLLRLEARARAGLEAPEKLSPSLRHVRALLRLWHYPAFGEYRVWLLWQELRKKEPVFRMRRVTWNRPQDVRDITSAVAPALVFESAQLRFEVADGVVQHERWCALAEEAEALSVPPLAFPKLTVGVDGERFGLEQDFFERSVRFEWWVQPPTEWRGLARWVNQARTLFDESLANMSS